MAIAAVPFPAPRGWIWVFCTRFWHYRAKRFLYAKDYDRKAWCFLVRSRKSFNSATPHGHILRFDRGVHVREWWN